MIRTPEDKTEEASPAPAPLTMTMRALLQKMEDTDLPLTLSPSGKAYLLVTRSDGFRCGTIHFWTALHVGRAAMDLGYVDQYRGITKAGRRAIRARGA